MTILLRAAALPRHLNHHHEWSLGTFILMRALQITAHPLAMMPFARLRALLDGLAMFAPRFAPHVAGIRCRRERIGGVPCQWFVPSNWQNDMISFVHFHGGGFSVCSTRTHHLMISELALAMGARGLGVNFRLAPEHPFPSAVEDCVSVYRALLHSGVDANQLILTGDSAGGALVLSTMLCLREAGLPQPRAGILISPFTDLECGGKSMVTNAPYDYLTPEALRFHAATYLQGQDPRHPIASPLHADLSGLPPLLIHAGGAEVLLSSIMHLAAHGAACGVDVQFQVWNGMVHAWHGFSFFLAEAQEALDAIGTYVRQGPMMSSMDAQARSSAFRLSPRLLNACI